MGRDSRNQRFCNLSIEITEFSWLATQVNTDPRPTSIDHVTRHRCRQVLATQTFTKTMQAATLSKQITEVKQTYTCQSCSHNLLAHIKWITYSSECASMRRCSHCAWQKPWSRIVADSGPQDKQDMERRGQKEWERKREWEKEKGQEKDMARNKKGQPNSRKAIECGTGVGRRVESTA